jgi:hypothetical protein
MQCAANPQVCRLGPEPKRPRPATQFRLGGMGGAASLPPQVVCLGPRPQTPAVGELPGRNGAGAKRRRSEAHAEPGLLTRGDFRWVH